MGFPKIRQSHGLITKILPNFIIWIAKSQFLVVPIPDRPLCPGSHRHFFGNMISSVRLWADLLKNLNSWNWQRKHGSTKQHLKCLAGGHLVILPTNMNAWYRGWNILGTFSPLPVLERKRFSRYIWFSANISLKLHLPLPLPQHLYETRYGKWSHHQPPGQGMARHQRRAFVRYQLWQGGADGVPQQHLPRNADGMRGITITGLVKGKIMGVSHEIWVFLGVSGLIKYFLWTMFFYPWNRQVSGYFFPLNQSSDTMKWIYWNQIDDMMI